MKRSTYTLRRLLALVLVLVMVGSLFAGCNKKDPDPTDPSVPNETIAETAEPTDATEEPTEEPTEVPTEPVETVPPVLMGTVNADNLNVRSEPYSTSDILKRLAINTRIEILEQKIVDGVNWGRIAEGWVNLNYVTIGVEFPEPGSTVVDNPNNAGTGSNASDATTSTTGTVTTGLNIRKEADADSASVGTYSKGDKVTILERSGDWGRTNKGWINTKYVDFTNSVTADSTSSSSSSGTNSTTVSNGNKAVLGYGTVVKTTSLAIRSGPGASYTQVSYVRKGERHPYYQTSSNGWVRFEKGWVNADYLELEYAVESGTEGTVTETTLSVREEADYNSERLATLEKGDEVTILETKGTWGLIEYASGQYGWIDLDKVKLPTPTVSNYTTGIATITADALHIREKASASSESLGTYVKGDKVTITEVSGNWGKTEDGWINLKYTKMEKTYTTGTGTVTASSLNIREEPSASSEDLGSLKKGEKVTILDTEGTWGKIEYKTGKYGWISLNYVNMTSTSTDSSSGSTGTGTAYYKVTVETPGNGTASASATSCKQGATVTITAKPATGYVLGSVEVEDANGNAVTVINEKTFSMPASNVTVTVKFVEATPYNITKVINDTAMGDVKITVAGKVVTKAAAGQKVSLSIEPVISSTTRHALSSLSVKKESGDSITLSNNSFTMPAEPVTITASFAESTATFYSITINDTAPSMKATITPSVTSAAKGDTVTLNIAPEPGYTVNTVVVKQGSTNVTVSGTGNTRTFTMPEGNVAVNVTLTASQYTVTTSKTGSGTVTVSSSKCEAGTTVTVTATPADGYVLKGEIKVRGPNNEIVELTGNSFPMPAYNVTVKVEFEKTPYAVSIGSITGGTVSADKTSAAKDVSVTLTATANTGYKLKTLLVKATSGGATVPVTVSGNKYTFKMPEGGVDVAATFEAIASQKWVTNQANLNVRAAADSTSTIVGTIPAAGTELIELEGSNASYLYIQIPGTSIFGYIGTWNLTKQ